MNENLLELIGRIAEVPEDLATQVRLLPQCPDEWLAPIRKILDSAGGKHVSELSLARKLKLANEVKKLGKKLRGLDGWPQGGELKF
jgi:hypothetical protein